jgi:hypothetical protein
VLLGGVTGEGSLYILIFANALIVTAGIYIGKFANIYAVAELAERAYSCRRPKLWSLYDLDSCQVPAVVGWRRIVDGNRRTTRGNGISLPL